MDVVLEIIHYIGIISFSAAGAMVAIDKETDWFGVVFLGFITCFGGGMIRDIIAGQAIGRELPLVFTEELKMSVIVSILTSLLMFFLAMIFKQKYVKEEATVDKINNVLDALGIGVFCAAGTASYMLDVGPGAAIVLGMISSIGGSITRDVILGIIPTILRKRIYALACLAGSSVYYVVAKAMTGLASAQVVATIFCIVVIFVIRMCATAFRWNMPKAIDFAKIKQDIEKEEKETTNV